MKYVCNCLLAVCCCLVNGYAQKSALLQTIVTLKQQIVQDSTFAPPCKTSVQHLVNNLPHTLPNTLSKQAAGKIISTCNTYLATAQKGSFKKACTGEAFEKMNAAVQSLVAEVNKEITATKDTVTKTAPAVTTTPSVNTTTDSTPKTAVKPATVTPARTLIVNDSNRPYFVISVLFLALLSGITILYFTLLKANKKLLHHYEWERSSLLKKQQTLLQEKEDFITVLNNNIAVLQAKTQPAANVIMPSAETTAYFVCEVLMTAGPRKKNMSEPNADIDLGEDVCGFITRGNHTFAWLLDGTSDLHVLRNPVNNKEYFSSRLLAKAMADCCRKNSLSAPDDSLEVTIDKAAKLVKTQWLQTINALPVEEKEVLKKNIADKNFPECATTILLAKVDLNGKFTGYRSGDSTIFLFDEKNNFIEGPLAEKNNETNDRLFFRITMDQGEFNIVSNKLQYEVIHHNNVHTVMLFSDGVSVGTERLLKEAYPKDAAATRSAVEYEIQGTADDKTICFIELKK